MLSAPTCLPALQSERYGVRRALSWPPAIASGFTAGAVLSGDQSKPGIQIARFLEATGISPAGCASAQTQLQGVSDQPG